MPIQIRPLKFSDHFALLPIYANPHVTLPAGMKPLQTQQQIDILTKELIENKNYVITLDHHIIGVIGCDLLSLGIGMLGFLIDEKYWNHGYGKQAVELYLAQAKKQGYQTIYADCFHDNKASKKILLHSGFTYLQDYEREYPDFPTPRQCQLYMIKL